MNRPRAELMSHVSIVSVFVMAVAVETKPGMAQGRIEETQQHALSERRRALIVHNELYRAPAADMAMGSIHIHHRETKQVTKLSTKNVRKNQEGMDIAAEVGVEEQIARSRPETLVDRIPTNFVPVLPAAEKIEQQWTVAVPVE